jgi:hypothetical protein
LDGLSGAELWSTDARYKVSPRTYCGVNPYVVVAGRKAVLFFVADPWGAMRGLSELRRREIGCYFQREEGEYDCQHVHRTE